MEEFLSAFYQFPEFNSQLSAGLIIFTRFLGFVVSAPVISRKEVPSLIKISFALLMAIVFYNVLDVPKMPVNCPFALCMFLNTIAGMFLGFVANVIFLAISAAGDIINMQMGLSSATMFDPSTKSQSSVLGSFFGLFAGIIYINIGGLYWLFEAFMKSFEFFGVWGTSIPLDKIASPEYLILVTANVLYVGLQLASPVLLATLGQDIILGIISKTAPQVNVFQLSFLFKPVLGAAILVFIMPMLLNVIQDYYVYYSAIIN